MNRMDSIAAEKRTAMLRYARLKKIATLFRCAEAVALAAVALWSSAQIPAAARSSGDLLRRILPVLLGPRFLFLLGNAIVLTLLFKSRRLSDADPSDAATAISSLVPPPPPSPPQAAPEHAAEPVFEDKKVLCIESVPPSHATRACRRSKSERLGDRRRSSTPELRRSETDVKAKGEEDEEEFRRTIEAFIERQWKFQREESMAIVCSSDATGRGLYCSAGTVEAKEIMTGG